MAALVGASMEEGAQEGSRHEERGSIDRSRGRTNEPGGVFQSRTTKEALVQEQCSGLVLNLDTYYHFQPRTDSITAFGVRSEGTTNIPSRHSIDITRLNSQPLELAKVAFIFKELGLTSGFVAS